MQPRSLVAAASTGALVLVAGKKDVNVSSQVVLDDLIINMMGNQVLDLLSNLRVDGNLTITSVGYINTAELQVAGNLTIDDPLTGSGGSFIAMIGSNNTTLTQNSDGTPANFIVRKSAGATVMMTTNVDTGSLQIVSGTLDLNKKTLTIAANGFMTVNGGATLVVHLDAVPLEQVVVGGDLTFEANSYLRVNSSGAAVSTNPGSPSTYDVGRTISADIIDNGMIVTSTADATGNYPVFSASIVVSGLDEILRLTGSAASQPAVQFSQSGFAKNEQGEGGTATITVTLSAPSSSQTQVDYATVAGGTATAGVDYQSTSGTLIFAPNQTSRTFTVTIYNDLLSENPDETINLALSNYVGLQAGSPVTATLKIVDDDYAPAGFPAQTPPAGDDCGCGGGSGDVIKTAAGIAAGAVGGFSEAALRYFDGIVKLFSTDLYSSGFGTDWGLERSWTNGTGYATGGFAGSGMVTTQLPYIRTRPTSSVSAPEKS